jgi:hypothetical protein
MCSCQRNRWIARSHDPDGDGPQDFGTTYFEYDSTPPSGSMLDLAAVLRLRSCLEAT